MLVKITPLKTNEILPMSQYKQQETEIHSGTYITQIKLK